jgi:hypothetical protein
MSADKGTPSAELVVAVTEIGRMVRPELTEPELAAAAQIVVAEVSPAASAPTPKDISRVRSQIGARLTELARNATPVSEQELVDEIISRR